MTHKTIARLLLASLVTFVAIGTVAASGATAIGPDSTKATTAGHRSAERTAPVVPALNATLVITFSDPVNGYHPMGITTDGTYYYTTNGGNAGACVVNTFDLSGNLVRSSPCSIDNRDIAWNPAAQALVAKSYDDNEYRIDPVTGQSILVGLGWFAYQQSSPALIPSGRRILEHESGTIRVLRASDGTLLQTLSGFRSGSYPSNEAVAVDRAGHILTWDGSTVFAQDSNANLLATVRIPFGTYGFALSYTNGLLFTADDINGFGNATWYGYTVSP
jgi:hypothetical protein